MKKVTLDSSCIYALSEDSDKTKFVQELVELHQQGKIIIQIPLTAAYENRRGKPKGKALINENLEKTFIEKIKTLGLDDAVYLLRPALLGDRLLYPSENLVPAGNQTAILCKEITNIIHPGLDSDKLLEEYQKKYPDADFSPVWNNQYRDVLIPLCHIISQGDVLISDDKHIYKKAKELERLGAGTVISCNEDAQKKFNVLLWQD